MDNIITGDNLLCSGDGPFPLAIKLWNRAHGGTGLPAEITHVAKAVREDGQLYVVESTVENKFIIDSVEVIKRGIQMNPFDVWLEHYGGKVWHQPVRGTKRGDRRLGQHSASVMRKRARMQRNKMWGLPYESGIKGLVELMDSFEKAENTNPEKLDEKARTSEVFCGETVAIIDQVCGILDMEIACHKWPPMKFADNTYQKHLINYEAQELIKLK